MLVLPPVDVLPYDAIRPSARTIGARVAALTRLADPATGPRLLLTSATASMQRVRPAAIWRAAALTLTVGDVIDREVLNEALAVRAYNCNELVDEPGETAFRGGVIDIFPSGETEPVRLHLQRDRIERITGVDLGTLRSTQEMERVTLLPALRISDRRRGPDRLDQDATLARPAPEPVRGDAGCRDLLRAGCARAVADGARRDRRCLCGSSQGRPRDRRCRRAAAARRFVPQRRRRHAGLRRSHRSRCLPHRGSAGAAPDVGPARGHRRRTVRSRADRRSGHARQRGQEFAPPRRRRRRGRDAGRGSSPARSP